MAKTFDSAALGSDVARSRKQYLARRFARIFVDVLGLNRPGTISTEIVQSIKPVATIDTRYGPLLCRADHGRLRWRAESFFVEEPETIAWLDALQPDDVFWDVGANVGLYSLYAAKFRLCRTLAFEPESQNFALLVENIVLNGISEQCSPMGVAVAEHSGLGQLRVRYVTKGGAYNLFREGRSSDEELPDSVVAAETYSSYKGFNQGVFGCSIDDLVSKHGLPAPTHLKIDVDGLEPRIIAGAAEQIRGGTLRGVLIELNAKSKEDMAVPDLLAQHGFRLVSRRSNWDSREDKSRAQDLPADNMIFERP